MPVAASTTDAGGGRDCLRTSEDTGERLGRAVLAYVLAVVLVVTLVPFDFAWPRHFRVVSTGTTMDVVANVILFTPLGFLYRLVRRAPRGSALGVLALGAVVSLAIESTQLFEVERYSSPLDVAANAVGAWLGALAQGAVARRLQVDARMVGRLALEMPLMGVVYLVVPLLWLDGLGAVDAPGRLWLTLVLALFGASLLASIHRYHLGPTGGITRREMALAAGAWFLVGAGPVLAVYTRAALLLGGLVVVRVLGEPGTPPLISAANRRFERPALVRAAPYYAVYLVSLAVLPLMDGVQPWSWRVGLPRVPGEWPVGDILRLLEGCAAFTVLGYIVAESHGRAEDGVRGALRRVAVVATCTALLTEFARGFEPDRGASALRGGLSLAAAVYGGWLYHLQRAHVRRLTSDATGGRRGEEAAAATRRTA